MSTNQSKQVIDIEEEDASGEVQTIYGDLVTFIMMLFILKCNMRLIQIEL